MQEHGHTLYVLDVETGRILRELTHEAELTSFACSSDGALLATGCDSGALVLWDADGPTKDDPLRHILDPARIAHDPQGCGVDEIDITIHQFAKGRFATVANVVGKKPSSEVCVPLNFRAPS